LPVRVAPYSNMPSSCSHQTAESPEMMVEA
jgi:hypothetical protein